MLSKLSATALFVFICACGDDEAMSKGEFCDQLGDQTCLRAVECNVEPYDACFQGFKVNCCINAGTCNNPAQDQTAAERLVENCGNALRSHECNSLASGILPSECLMQP